MNKQELNKILELHKKWFSSEEGGERADLRYADLRGVNLIRADLRRADLEGADLSGANLYRADLEGVTLEGVDLRYTNLQGADLSRANLLGANLRGTNLREANLYYCIGNNREIKTLQLGTYHVNICGDQIAIGCKQYSVDEWKSFTDEQILAMNGEKALSWWKLNRNSILTISSREL